MGHAWVTEDDRYTTTANVQNIKTVLHVTQDSPILETRRVEELGSKHNEKRWISIGRFNYDVLKSFLKYNQKNVLWLGDLTLL